MPRIVLHLTALLLLVYGGKAQGSVDCQKRPSFNHRDVKDCCKIPEPNWQAYAGECSQHINILHKGANPCILECIFNTTQAIRNNEIVMENVRPMLSKLYSDQFIIDGYANGFKKCGPSVKQKIEEFKASGRNTPKSPNFFNQQCSPLAFVYAMCAHRNLFIDCPAPVWTSTPVCDSAKEFVKNCDFTSGGKGGGNRGLGNPLRGAGRRGGF